MPSNQDPPGSEALRGLSGTPARDSSTGRHFRPWSTAQIPSRRSLTCLGRQEELRRAYTALREAERGEGSVFAVIGPSGIGKSRLLAEIEVLAGRQGFEIRRGIASPDSTLPLFPILQAIAPASLLAKRPVGPVIPNSRHERLNIDLSILDLLRALEALAHERPQLVVFDDFESADAESLRALGLMAGAVQFLPVLVLVAAKTDFVSSPGFADWLRGPGSGMVHRRRVEVVRLEALAQAPAVKMLESYLGRGARVLPHGLAPEELVVRAGGNPFFVLEMVDAYAQPRDRTGGVGPRRSREQVTESGSPPIPSAVRELITARLSGLDIHERTALQVAARLGLEFPAGALDVALPASRPRASDTLKGMARRAWPVYPVPGRRGWLRFEHELLREVLRERRVSRPERSALARLARWWERVYPEESIVASNLWAGARRPVELVEAWKRAIEQVISTRAPRQVVPLFRRLTAQLAELGQGEDRLALLCLGACERLRGQGEKTELLAMLDELDRVALGVPERLRADLLRIEAELFVDVRVSSDALERLERRLGQLRVPLDSVEFWRIRYLRAVLSLWHTSADASVAEVLETLRRMRPRPELAFESLALYSAATAALSNMRQTVGARRLLAEARQFVRNNQVDPSAAELVLNEVESMVAVMSGDAHLARRLLRRIIESYQRRGYPDREALEWVRLAGLELADRDLKMARVCLETASRLSSPLGLTPTSAYADVIWGWTSVVEGDWRGADRYFSEARELNDQPTDSVLLTFRRIGEILVRARTVDPVGALEELGELETTVEPETLSCGSEFLRAKAAILELMNRPDESRAALQRGLDLSRASGTTLDEVATLAELEEWYRRHGTQGEAKRTRDDRLRLAHRHALRPESDRTGITFVRAPGPTASPPPIRPRDPGRAVASLQTLILSYLGASKPLLGVGDGARDSSIGATEVDLARDLGIPRERFARTLGRLREGGHVARRRVRVPGRKRLVYAYSLSASRSTP